MDLAAVLDQQHDPSDLGLLLALEGASGLVRAYTGQTFDLLEDDVVAMDGSGTEALLLPELPVASVSEVVEIDNDGTETTLEVDDYRLGASGVLYRLDSSWSHATWCPGHANIQVTYTHGYSLPEGNDPGTLPPEIQMVVLNLAARGHALSAGRLVRSETIGSYSVTYGDSTEATEEEPLSRVERAVLERYRYDRLA